MAKVNIKNIKKNKKNSLNDKKSIDGQKEKELKETKRKQKIITETENAISELENEIKNSNLFKKNKKNEIVHNLDKLKQWIDENNIDELERWLISFNELKEIEAKEIRDREKEKALQRSFKEIIKDSFKITRIPIYTRVKNIIKTNDTKNKYLKLLGIFGFSLLLIGVFTIGLLMIIGTIPFVIYNFPNGASIFGGILIAISIGLFYFI